MPFDFITRTLLEEYANDPPRIVEDWYGPWNTILMALFPSSHYIVIPHRRVIEASQTLPPDLLFEVAKILIPPVTLRTVLIVQVKNPQHWESSKDVLMRQLRLRTDAAFAGTAAVKVYWIETIGPHWRYGEKEDDDQDPRPLIAWHHVTHDQDSYRDLTQLADLVDRL